MSATMKNFRNAALAALVSVLATGPALAANPAAGQEIAKGVCQACHGVDGNSQNADFPKIGGQHPDYLAKALRDYQSGARNNPIMKGMAGALKAEDVDNVAAWYGSQAQVLGVKH